MYRWQPDVTMQNDTNHSIMNTQLISGTLMSGTTSRSMKTSSEDQTGREELEMCSLKRVNEEETSNYSSIHTNNFCDGLSEHLSKR